jgi:HK97 gp10 family phage protein
VTDRFIAQLENSEALLKDLRDVNANTKQTLKGAVRAGTKVIRNAAEARAAALSSRAGKKTRARVRTRSGFVVGAVFPGKGFGHLKLLEYGTKAGRRWALKKGPFRFYAGNRLVVTRMIRHPGTAQQQWLAPAFEAAKNEAAQAVGEALRDAIEKAKITPEGSDS